MKKLLIFVLVLVAVVFPAAAKTNLINLGYNIHGKIDEIEEVNLRSIGVDFIFLSGDSAGFYSQINPYFGMSVKGPGGINKLSDFDETLFGSNFILGYGGDINFGNMGLILGGGLFLDANYWWYANWDTFQISLSAGLGIGANFYFQPGEGNLVINAGLSLAWRPYTYYIWESSEEAYFDSGKTNANFNIGVGWRTGGIGSKNSKSSSSSGGSSGGSDW
ncbi:MAG: hypothetical protein DRZ90_05745 [Spirochaetes bacterium]|nr:MAG: hypothetical protein DRZ90_05745 [Spirochaetota bacterium]